VEKEEDEEAEAEEEEDEGKVQVGIAPPSRDSLGWRWILLVAATWIRHGLDLETINRQTSSLWVFAVESAEVFLVARLC